MSSPDQKTGPNSGRGLQADAQQEALGAVKRAWKAERGRGRCLVGDLALGKWKKSYDRIYDIRYKI
jgi:hypothetical protein